MAKLSKGDDMQAIIHQWAFNGSFDQLASLPRQELVNDWFGYDVEPSAEFAFATDGQYLWFLAARNREATVHPDARPGQFQPELWRYDLAEWFLASGEGTNYWEFNLAPNGAWWACAFTDVRRANEDIPAPLAVDTECILTDEGWCAMARIPLNELRGVDIRDCKLAATFILETPDQLFLTTADDLSGEPDFHRPDCFSTPILK